MTYWHKGLGVFFGTHFVVTYDILFSVGAPDNLLFGRDQSQIGTTFDSGEKFFRSTVVVWEGNPRLFRFADDALGGKFVPRRLEGIPHA